MSAQPLLEVDALRIEAQGGEVLLDGLSFCLARGERLGIVGESGSGKTLATRAIPGLLPQGVHRTGGAVRFEGQDLARLDEDALRKVRGAGIGLVFQEPMTSLNPALTVGRQLAEGLRLHRGLSAAEIRERSIAMLRRVQITDPEGALQRHPHEFSGGMRQRIMLASVLLVEPKLLIADEPTTALDTLSQREVLDLMAELTLEMGTGLLLITHDLGLVARYTSRVLVMRKGLLVEEGPTHSVLASPSHPYTAKLVGSLPRRTAPRAPAPEAETPILAVRSAVVEVAGTVGLFKRSGPKRILDGVDLEVRRGEIVALVGSSGSGKTTLGRAALGLAPLAAGEIRFDGVSIAAMDRSGRRAFRRAAQLVFQDPFSSLDSRLRVGEIVGASLRNDRALSPSERQGRVQAMLDAVGLEAHGQRLPHQLSGGQRQRVAIARALVSQPRLVVADEPVSALDLTIQHQVLDLLQRLQKERGFACLFITHDLAVVDQIADRVVVLDQGRVVETGRTDAILASPSRDYTRRLIAATPGLALAGLAAEGAQEP